ncbi:MAG TPA: hypothetical protein VFC99_11870 [Acidimicrobiia bacterium]|nr:hypothetical protein [Acidimicrobiia bacterium]
MATYRAEIWAVTPNGTAHGIESDVAIDDLESRAWSGSVLGTACVPGRDEPGPVYVRIGKRTAAADVVTADLGAGRPTVTLLGVSPFE